MPDETQIEAPQAEEVQNQPGQVEQLLDPYKPVEYFDEQGNPVELTHAEKSEYRKKAGLVDPMLDLTPEEMADLSRQTLTAPEHRFSILTAFDLRQQELEQDPEAVNRASKAWKLYRDSTGLMTCRGLPRWRILSGAWSKVWPPKSPERCSTMSRLLSRQRALWRRQRHCEEPSKRGLLPG